MKYLLICGGVGGAKLALGFSKAIDSNSIDIVVNTGDDFNHLGLYVCPDLDTVTYTLSDKVDLKKGWGRSKESWQMLTELDSMGGDTWFQLGDKDLATHIYRTFNLSKGKKLTEVTKDIKDSFGIKENIYPMSDDSVSTFIKTKKDILSFQEYFVKYKCEPTASDFVFKGALTASFNKKIKLDAYDKFIICPSNPFISIGPILALRKFKDYLKNRKQDVVIVSPIVNDRSIKGPTSKIFKELGFNSTVVSVANYYNEVSQNIFIDNKDKKYLNELNELGFNVYLADLIMKDIKTKKNLADSIISQLSES